MANDATAEKIFERRKQIIEEEQERIAEELNISRDTYEGRLEVLEELTHRVSSGQTPATWLDIEEEEQDVQSAEEQPDEIDEDEIEDDDAAEADEGETATVTGEPEPEAPSSAPVPSRSNMVDVMDSFPVSAQYLEDQYREYEYCTVEVNGSLQQAVRIGEQEIPLEFSSGWDLNGYHLFFSKQMKDHLTQLSKVVRQHARPVPWLEGR